MRATLMLPFLDGKVLILVPVPVIGGVQDILIWRYVFVATWLMRCLELEHAVLTDWLHPFGCSYTFVVRQLPLMRCCRFLDAHRD